MEQVAADFNKVTATYLAVRSGINNSSGTFDLKWRNTLE